MRATPAAGTPPARTPAHPGAGADQHLRRGSFVSPLAAVRLALVSMHSGWRLRLAVGLGMLVATVLACTVPVYTTLGANVQLQAIINRQGPAGRNVEIVASTRAITPALRQQQDAIVQPLASRYLKAFAGTGVTNYLSAQPLVLVRLDRSGAPIPVAAYSQAAFLAYDYTQATAHMQLLAGSFPRSPQPGRAGPADALVTQQMATVLGVRLGDLLTTQLLGGPAAQVMAKIVGIWQPKQVDDPFWNGRIFTTNPVRDIDPYVFPVLLDQDAFVAALATAPGVEVAEHWVYSTVPAHITAANAPTVAAGIAQLHAQLVSRMASLGSFVSVLSGLPGAIEDLLAQVGSQQQALYIIVAQLVGLALLFVARMADLLVAGQALEIATLKSRGASGTQLLGSYAAQGLLLGGIAALAGPWLGSLSALALIAWFIPTTTLQAAGTDSATLARLAMPGSVAAPAVAGGLLGMGAILLATQRAARLDVLAFRREQGRASDTPFWRRTYLDVFLLVLCLLGYIELSQFGGLGVRAQPAQGGSSPFLLAAPALLLLAGSLLMLRLFPLMVKAGLLLAARGRGISALLAFAQMARSAGGAARLALLLALGVGLGLFALTFDASLARNASDRATYSTGADLRLVQSRPEGNGLDAAIQRRLAGLPGLEGVTPVYRSQVSTAPGETATNANFLAIDPQSWPSVAGATSWRPDFADAPLDVLMGELHAHQQSAAADQGSGNYAGDAGHPLWALVSQTFADGLTLRVGDRFALSSPDVRVVPFYLSVGAIVREFPTLYPAEAGGFVVVGLEDYETISITGVNGPNEYWLRVTTDPAQRAALLHRLAGLKADADFDHTLDRRALEATFAGNPAQAGMRGLLTVGALVAAVLAVVGILAQATLAARLRAVQFAVLRALGTSGRQLTRLLLAEHVILYAFGLLSGMLVGFVLASATLPYLAFSDTTTDPATLGIPPYRMALDPTSIALFFAALVGAFLVAVLVLVRYAAHIGLGRALRLGED